MRIIFVLPRPTKRIVGGYKIVYEYANYLCSHENEVFIAYDCEEIGTRFGIKNSLIKKEYGKYLRYKADWINIDKRIREIYISRPSELSQEEYDIVIATAINTVGLVYNSACKANSNKVYLIQDFENWVTKDEEVYKTYTLPIDKVVVSKWLFDLVAQSCGSTDAVYLCPNGIDLTKYNLIVDIEERNSKSICFLYHRDERKGMRTLLPVIDRLKQKYNDLGFMSFGAFDSPSDLPQYVDYYPYATPEQVCKIYNSSAIFVCSSYEEGFGLTGAESMACGCALVTTNTRGSREYANKNNSIICEARSEEALFNSIEKLLIDNELRVDIAKQGYKSIQEHSAQHSCYLFDSIINQIAEKRKLK